jgi:hypothetical protein
MGQVRPGDIVSIKNPERNSLVKAGRLNLRAPNNIAAIVPDDISKKDLVLLDSLSEWGIININGNPTGPLFSVDPLEEHLLNEYLTLDVKESISLISKVNTERKDNLLQYEKGHKNRKTVLKAFE